MLSLKADGCRVRRLSGHAALLRCVVLYNREAVWTCCISLLCCAV